MEITQSSDVSVEMEASPSLEVANDVESVSDNATASNDQVTPEQNLGAETPAGEAAVPAYQPNYKFKVKDQEKEIDEMFRPLIKDADTEKKIKELFEKAHGLDFVKEDRAAYKREYEGFKSQVKPVLQEYHQFTTLRDKGNIGAALQVAGITDEQIYKYALERLEIDQNPAQAQLYKNHQEQTLKEFQMEQELQQYKHRDEQTAQEKFHTDLQTEISKHQALVSQFDSRYKPGAFMEEVIAYGVLEASRKNIISVEQAVEAVANKFKPLFNIASAQTQAAPQSAPQAPQQNRPATLPNVGASNVSPIKAKVKSIDDIRRAAAEA